MEEKALTLTKIQESDLGYLLNPKGGPAMLQCLLQIAPHEAENIIPLVTLANIMIDIKEDQHLCIDPGPYNEKGKETDWSRRLRANRATAVRMAKELFPYRWHHVVKLTNQKPETENERKILQAITSYDAQRS